jgi:glucokinase
MSRQLLAKEFSQMAVRYAVGVDIGGTKIYAGVIDLETGQPLSTARKRTHPERGMAFFVERLREVIATALDGAKLPNRNTPTALGVGIAGQVDREHGVVLGAPNLAQGLANFAIAEVLTTAFGMPVVIGNDVEVAALGEQYFGAAVGQAAADFVYVSIGTGVGGAIMREGVIYRGASGTAGEIGHTVVAYNGRFCSCGGRGHLEAYASRTAITKVLRAEMARGRKTKLTDLIKPDDSAIRSKMLARCIEEGDGLVTEALSEAADYLGAGIGSLASFYNPHCVILGGGLIEAVPLFFERAALRAREVAMPIAGRQLAIECAKLGDDSGIVGAACMAGLREAHPGASPS